MIRLLKKTRFSMNRVSQLHGRYIINYSSSYPVIIALT